jgi:hypothetical protein
MAATGLRRLQEHIEADVRYLALGEDVTCHTRN